MPLPKTPEALEADVLPNEILHTTRFHITDPVLLNNLALSSHKFHSIFQTSRLISRLLFHVTRNNRVLVKKLFEISPAHIEYLIARDIIKDDAGRKLRVSGFEYALWAQNVDMLRTMIKSLQKASDEGYNRAEHVRLELIKQYDNVVDNGLNYTYEQIKINDGQPFMFTIHVKGEKHFQLTNIPCNWGFPVDAEVKKNRIYLCHLEPQDKVLQYKLISLSGELVTDTINVAELVPQPKFKTGAKEPHLLQESIIKIAAERGQTHPVALISALKSYKHQCHREDPEEQRELYWCQVVGGAQLMIPYHFAQWYQVPCYDSCEGEARYFNPPKNSEDFWPQRHNSQAWWLHPPFKSGLGESFAISSRRAINSRFVEGARAVRLGINPKIDYKELQSLSKENAQKISDFKNILASVFTDEPSSDSESDMTSGSCRIA